MLLVHTPKVTPRIDFVFKHIFTRILGVKVGFTSVVEDFIAHQGPKMTYGNTALGNELFIKSHGLLGSQGVEDISFQVDAWDDTFGFFKTNKKSAIPYDIFAASFYLLSRYEEYLPHVKDDKGRFPATESIAFKNGFLRQPIVDIWAYKLLSVIQSRFPDFLPDTGSMTIHSLVVAEQPFKYDQKGFVRTMVGIGRAIYKLRFKKIWSRLQVITRYKSDPFNIYNWLVKICKGSRNDMTIFFMMGDHKEVEKGFDPHRKKFRSVVKLCADYSYLGLLLSGYAFEDINLLIKEKRAMEECTYRTVAGSLIFDYVVNLPERYRKLVEAEIERDFSMVYEEEVGFRAGTCTPFLFYDLDYEIKTPLTIQPIAFTTSAFNKRYESDSLQQISRVYQSVRSVNGTFSLFFSNEDLVDTPANAIWRSLLSEKLHSYER